GAAVRRCALFALCRYGGMADGGALRQDPGAIVTDVEVRPASAGTHERHQLTVSYNEAGRRAGLPVSIFTKSLPSIVTRMIGGFNGTARVEGSFFTQIRPQLDIEAPLC